MHGIIRPVPDPVAPARYRRDATVTWLRRWRAFLAAVVAPTVLLAGYYYLIAADQYESEVHFSVSQGGGSAISPSGFGDLVGFGASSQAQNAAISVSDYLRSHDAVDQLQARVNLIAIFGRPEGDFVTRLANPAPSPEILLRSYRRWVSVHFDRDTGLTTLKVRTFRPQDSFRLAQAMLVLGERRVNEMNMRRYADAVAAAERQLDLARASVGRTQREITAFRRSRGDINPQNTGQAQLTLVSGIKDQVTAGRAQLDTLARVVGRESPQYTALAQRVRSLEASLSAQQGQLAGGSSGIAADLGGYEDLRVRQDFVAKSYSAAAASVEKAQDEAQRQQLYLVRVVNPNLPVKSLFPQRARILLTTLLALVIVYSIAWLIAAGVREHAA